ncbi:MAG: hypothetical protein AW07_01616 [Candidatus Accumulibacter sp. SK-11]|nr:MAG: hypothetical protein AW07_01616 [Candidatus Accumulibacter sp. SK-11]
MVGRKRLLLGFVEAECAGASQPFEFVTEDTDLLCALPSFAVVWQIWRLCAHAATAYPPARRWPSTRLSAGGRRPPRSRRRPPVG